MFVRNFSIVFRLAPVLLTCLFAGSGSLALASTGTQYVSLRAHNHCDRKLSYADVQANPANYVGRVLELHGVIGGTAGSGADITVMLTLADKNAITLEIPKAEAALLRQYFTPRVRMLVKVGEGGCGNVVPLTVLAMAHDSEVGAIEREEAAREAAVARAEQRRRQQEQRIHADAVRAMRGRQSSLVASRGGFGRVDLPSFTDANAMAATYARNLGPRVQSFFIPYYNYIGSHHPRLGMSQAGEITFNLLRFADQYDVDPRLVVAMIEAESGFNPDATSRTGAMGLGQLMPGTARALGVSNPYNLAQNLAGSIYYLRGRLDACRWNKALAMAAYNAGTGAVRKYGGIPPYRETQAYVRRVITKYQELGGQP